MTKKTGLYDMDFTLTIKELTTSIKYRTEGNYRSLQALLGSFRNIINPMQVSGYRPRTMQDYDTILHNFANKKCLFKKQYHPTMFNVCK